MCHCAKKVKNTRKFCYVLKEVELIRVLSNSGKSRIK